MGEKAKNFFRSLGKASRRVTELGRAKIELMEANGKLDGRYRALGKAVAARFMDASEGSVEATEPFIKGLIDEIQEARDRVAEIEGRIKTLKGPED